jgi:S1-C subfamily serine protease
MRFFVAIFCAVSLFSLMPAAASNERVTPVVKAVSSVQDSVVNIRVDTVKRRQGPWGDPFFDEFMGFGGTYKSQSVGTGVVYDRSGLVVTNYHVISDATAITVFTQDNRQYSARFIGGDESLDLAVLKVDDANLNPIRLGSSADIMPGETVIAIGNPYGLSSSVTTGVVSGSRRIVKVGNAFSVFIQTDALINPGNSGGPLINTDGEVIGINTAMYRDAQGIGFAIPIDTVRRIVPELVRYKSIRQGYLGFSLYSDGERLTVSEVETGTGVRKGDTLLILDALPVNSIESVNYILKTFPPGETLTAVFRRDGRDIHLKLTLLDIPERYGFDTLRSRYGLELVQKSGGFAVRKSIYPQYIREGDYIIAINAVPVKTLGDINRAISSGSGDGLKLRISSGNRTYDIVLK